METTTSIDFDQMLAEMAAFVKKELLPLEATFLKDGFYAILPIIEEKRKIVKAKGWWTPQMPADAGGPGFTLQEFGRVSEVLGYSPFGHYTFNCQAPDAGNMEILHKYATPEQHEKYFKPLLAGEIRSCFSMTEPEFAGSNPVRMGTTAVKDGDDYIINGHKWFTSSADGASFAIVMAVTNPEAEKPHQRASQIIVPLDTPGFEHVRKISIMGEEGEGHSSHSEVRYNDVRVPQANLLGEEAGGFRIAQERLGPGRIHHCMRWIGICERVFEMMCRRAATRELSPGVPLGSKQTIQNWIAESRAEINAARLMVLDTADKIDTIGAKDARVEVSSIKFYVAGVLLRVLDHAVQIHGAYGVTDDLILSWWYRHERGARIYDGPDEVHKSVIARQELKKYGYDARKHR